MTGWWDRAWKASHPAGRGGSVLPGVAALVVGVCAGHGLAQGPYALVPVPPAPGGGESIVSGIDGQGRIVGTTRTASGQRVAAMWPAPGEPPVLLGVLDGGTTSEATGIDGGLAVGWGDRACGRAGAFVWFEALGLLSVGPPGCTMAVAVAVDATAGVLVQVGDPAQPMVWPLGGGEPTVLESWGQGATVLGISASGHVVGASSGHPDAGGRTRAIEWSPGGSARLLGRLDALAAGPDVAQARNDQGLIVGQARVGSTTRAAVWDASGQPLDAGQALGEATTSALRAINAHGLAVGESSLGAIVWSADAGTRLLRDLVDASATGWTLTSATGVNDDGLIVGNGLDPQRRPRGFVLVPAASACPADLDGDGALTIFDFLTFQNLFDAGDPRADFDGDGSLTIFDFLAFQNAFDAGC